jgi:hypothetical protein
MQTAILILGALGLLVLVVGGILAAAGFRNSPDEPPPSSGNDGASFEGLIKRTYEWPGEEHAEIDVAFEAKNLRPDMPGRKVRITVLP